MPTSLLPFLALLSGAACIGLSPIFVRLSDLGPVAIGFYRVALAVPLLLVFAGLWKSRPRLKPMTRRNLVLAITLASLFFTGDLVLWHSSLNHTSVANSTLLANLAIIFVTLGAWLLFKQHVTLAFVGGMCCALLGASLLGISSLQTGAGSLYGDVLALGAAMCYASYLLCISWMRGYLGTRKIMLFTCLGCTALLLPAALLFESRLLPTDMAGWLVLIALAWVPQAFGQGLIAYGMGYVPAALSAVTLLVQPVVAALLAWLLFAEQLTLLQGIGALAVMLGLVWCKQSTGASKNG